MGLATTALRVSTGALLVGHGMQKLAGKFGGPGLDATASGFEKIGLAPGKPYATAAGVSEALGGAMLAAGLFTPIGASMVTGTMLVAIAKVHGKNGVWMTKGGYEYNLTLIAAAFALTEIGPGRLALDGLLTKRRSGFGWAVAQLALGAAGAAATIELAKRTAPAAAEPAEVAAPASGTSD